MQTMTSRDAYVKLLTEGKLNALEGEIYRIIESNGPMSRKEIERHTIVELSSVCGRVKSLIDLNLVAVVGKEIDPDTGNTVELVGTNISDAIKPNHADCLTDVEFVGVLKKLDKANDFQKKKLREYLE